MAISLAWKRMTGKAVIACGSELAVVGIRAGKLIRLSSKQT